MKWSSRQRSSHLSTGPTRPAGASKRKGRVANSSRDYATPQLQLLLKQYCSFCLALAKSVPHLSGITQEFPFPLSVFYAFLVSPSNLLGELMKSLLRFAARLNGLRERAWLLDRIADGTVI